MCPTSPGILSKCSFRCSTFQVGDSAFVTKLPGDAGGPPLRGAERSLMEILSTMELNARSFMLFRFLVLSHTPFSHRLHLYIVSVHSGNFVFMEHWGPTISSLGLSWPPG